MWLLECDGEILDRKKLWLKPGQRYLFGRNKIATSENEQSFAMSNNNISKKHLVIEVAPVGNGECEDLNRRSKITLIDTSTYGTTVDGSEELKKSSMTLSGKHHTIKLAKFPQILLLNWRPVVFTFQGKEKTLRHWQAQLEPLDIKIMDPYITTEVTHAMIPRRNVPRGLRALINGAYVVTEAFAETIVAACQARGDTLGSLLEEDFEANWPKAIEFVPPPGNEPVPRSAEYYKPDPVRRHIFGDFTFIFATVNAYEQLGAVVSDGGAKALKYNVIPGETSVAEFVAFVIRVAENKGIRSLGDTEQGKGVVFVRFRNEEHLDWSVRFIESVDAELGQRSIEQNEFLDAILTNDVSKLRQGLQEESQYDGGIRAPPSTAIPADRSSRPGLDTSTQRRDEPSQNAAQEQVLPSQSARSEAAKLRSRRVIQQSRFKTFDDGFDASQFSTQRRKSQAQEMEDSDDDEEEDGAGPSQSQARSINQEQDEESMFIQDSQDPSTQRTSIQASFHASRKRPAPSSQPEAAEDVLTEALFPAAAAMKRRKLEDEAAGRTTSTLRNQPVEVEPLSKRKTKQAAPEKEIDVPSAARIRAAQIEAARQANLAPVDEELDPETIAAMRNVALIEDMPLRKRAAPAMADPDDPTSNWDDQWNGRKNFKKFVKRRPGTAESFTAPANNRARRVIVTLEEVKRKTFGMEEEDYFLQPAPAKRKSRNHTQASQSQSQAQHSQNEETSQRRGRRNDEYVQHTGAADEDDQEDLEPEEVAGRPRAGPVADALRRLKEGTGERQHGNPGAVSLKRAAGVVTGAPPSKMRAAPARARERSEEDEDSDGEVKFRLRRPVRK